MKRWLKIFAVLIVVAAAVLAFAMSHNSACPSGPLPALPGGTTTMKAAVYRCYGSPEVVKLAEVARPVPADDEVLVKVRAAGINPVEWHYMRGEPYIMRLGSGFGRPKDPRLGVDFSGTVEAVGGRVTKFKPGEPVFGARSGALAEYVTVPESRNLLPTPERITFEQAAGVGVAGVTALQALRDKGQLKPGQRVLINGASGGVGTFAVQIAKALGADVTGVCSTRNLDLVRSIGADHVIDYTKQDFTAGTERYDLVVDMVGNHSFGDVRRVLVPSGRYVVVGGTNDNPWIGGLGTPLKAMLVSPFVKQKAIFFIAKFSPEDLGYLARLMSEGKLTPVVDRRYPLDEVAEALGYLEKGHARGKVIIDVAPEGPG
jgi:NADPH:quinone reductase-like Zn-dependent oxidoreductase